MCYAVICCEQRRGEDIVMNKTIVKAKDVLEPIGGFDGGYPDVVIRYFKYYGLDFDADDVEHIFGTIESDGTKLACHIYKPVEYKATVVLMHGYFDHCGQLNLLIEYLLEEGYAVAAFDLPGHGLSGGKQGEIEDFDQYSRALIDFTDTVKGQLNEPYYFIGHSTGAAAMVDFLLTGGEAMFDKIILTAPLVHCSGWEQSKISYNEKIQFVKNVPRKFRRNSSNAAFLDFVKNRDPLQARKIPLKWVRAMHKWNDKISDLPTCDRPVKIIQGTSDETIDWQYNIRFLKGKFSNAQVSIIENAKHELYNETEGFRNEVFSQISDYLEGK
jgi:lysophospholipase